MEAPYRKVGLVCWKDFKTLQLNMHPVLQSLIMTQFMPNMEWQMGYLNDEVGTVQLTESCKIFGLLSSEGSVVYCHRVVSL